MSTNRPEFKKLDELSLPAGGVYARKSQNASPLPLIIFCCGAVAVIFAVLTISRIFNRGSEGNAIASTSPTFPTRAVERRDDFKELRRSEVPKSFARAETAAVIDREAPAAELAELEEGQVDNTADGDTDHEPESDVPPALRPVGQPNDPIHPEADLIGDESVDQVIVQLHTSPSVSVRRNAALLLAEHRGNSEAVIVALLEGARKDSAYSVRSACVRALGAAGRNGTRQAEVLVFLKELVFSEESIEDKQIAAESLLFASPNSTHAQQVLRIALVGGKGTTPVASSTVEWGESSRIWSWRHWAYDKLSEPRVDSDWAVPYLIKIAEVELDEAWGEDMGGQTYSSDLGESIEENATLMFTLAPRSPAVKAHFKKYLNTVLQNWEGATRLRVHYDSLLKKIALLETEAADNS